MTKSFKIKVSYDCVETVNAENLDDAMELAKIQVAKDLALGLSELQSEVFYSTMTHFLEKSTMPQ